MQRIMAQLLKSPWIRPWIKCVVRMREFNIVGHPDQTQAILLRSRFHDHELQTKCCDFLVQNSLLPKGLWCHWEAKRRRAGDHGNRALAFFFLSFFFFTFYCGIPVGTSAGERGLKSLKHFKPRATTSNRVSRATCWVQHFCERLHGPLSGWCYLSRDQ